jgi:hypothetical protein
MAAFHLPATLAELMYQRRSAWPAAAGFPHPSWNGRLNASPAKLPPEVGAVVALVSGQASWALARSPLRSQHLHLVYDLKTHSDFRYIGCGHQMYGAAFTFPAVGDTLTAFLAGTKQPSRKAWFQSNLA